MGARGAPPELSDPGTHRQAAETGRPVEHEGSFPFAELVRSSNHCPLRGFGLIEHEFSFFRAGLVPGVDVEERFGEAAERVGELAYPIDCQPLTTDRRDR